MNRFLNAHILYQIKITVFLMTKKGMDDWLYENFKYIKTTDARKKNVPAFQTRSFPLTRQVNSCSELRQPFNKKTPTFYSTGK